jgi:hypothetical protein
VNILVALLALGWGSLEIGIHQLRPQIGRLVTVDAGCAAMSAQQWE